MRSVLTLGALTFLCAGACAQNLTHLVLDQSKYVGGDSIEGKVFLDANASQNRVVALSDNTGVVNSPASCTVATGKKTASFSATTSAVGSVSSRSISATLNGITKTSLFTLYPRPALSEIILTPNQVVGGAEGFIGKIRLTGISPKPGTYVNLSDNSSAINLGQPQGFAPNGFDYCGFGGSKTVVGAIAVRQVSATLNGITKTADVTLYPRPVFTELYAVNQVQQGGYGVYLYVRLQGRAPRGGALAEVVEVSPLVKAQASPWYVRDGEYLALDTFPTATHEFVTVSVQIYGVSKSVTLLLTPP